MPQLVIYDYCDMQDVSNGINVSLSDSDKCISVLHLMTKWRNDLIKEYITMIYSCGFSEDRLGNNTYKNLLIRPNFSFWWMTLLSEKSPIRSSSIYKIFQARIIERLFLEYKCKSMILYSNDEALHKLLLNWSNVSGVNYERKKTPIKRVIKIRRLYDIQPNFIKACYVLFSFILKRRRFFGNFKKMEINNFSNKEIPKRFVISPFPSMDKSKFQSGVFKSLYWGDIQQHLCNDFNVNFLFMYTPTKECKSVKDAIKKRDFLRSNSNGMVNYYFLEEWLTYKDFFKIFNDYLFLYKKSFKYKKIRENSRINNSNIFIWKIIKSEWFSSTRGVVSMDGCIKLRLFEKCLESFKDQYDGFYLVENQPWERSLNYFWKKNSKSSLYGVQNALFRPFDLRFYEDSRVYNNCPKFNYPKPSILLVNGRYSNKSILKFGYPKNLIRYVEAYKFLHLLKSKNKVLKNSNINKKKTILVIGDGLHIFAKSQIKMLAQALNNYKQKKNYTVIIKSHPFCDVSSFVSKYFDDVNYVLSYDSLAELWRKADIVYASNMTSSGLESLIIGIPTIIHLDCNGINLSPALDYGNVMFASSPQSLLDFIESPRDPKLNNNFLCLDGNLTKWKLFLSDISPSRYT